MIVMATSNAAKKVQIRNKRLCNAPLCVYIIIILNITHSDKTGLLLIIAGACVEMYGKLKTQCLITLNSQFSMC